MKRIQITHKTEYYYKTPVIFGAHRALVRPREGHDVHIESSVLEIEPKAHVRWHRDIYGNSIAMLTFAKPGSKLSLFSRLVVAHYVENPFDFIIDPNAMSYPFQYPAEEQTELIPFRLPSYPRDGAVLRLWLSDLYTSTNPSNMCAAKNRACSLPRKPSLWEQDRAGTTRSC
jgi:transglutaminase-like putative cysteine protease